MTAFAALFLPCLLVSYSASADDLASLGASLGGQISVFFEILNASVIDELNDDGPYTIFAPNDDAAQNFSWPTNQTELADLIRYHVVRGNFTTDLLNGTMEALDGSIIVSEPIDIDNERIIAVNDAYIVEGDYLFDNGVLHIVSKVLDPSYQNEANQNDDGQGGTDIDNDGQGQSQNQQQPPYNGYNEAARMPYQPQGYGAAPYQAQNGAGSGRFDLPGLGLNSVPSADQNNNRGLGAGLNAPLGGVMGNNNNGWNGDRRPFGGDVGDDSNGDEGNGRDLGRVGGGGPSSIQADQLGGSSPLFRGAGPQFDAGPRYGQDNGLTGPQQNDDIGQGDDQDAVPQGLPQGDSDPIISRGGNEQPDGPGTGLDSWGQPQQRPRSLLDEGRLGPGFGGQNRHPGLLGGFGQPQSRPMMGGGSLLQSPVFAGRMSPQRVSPYSYPQ